MSEIVTPILPLPAGVPHIPEYTNSDYIVGDQHTGADIARFLVSQIGWADAAALIEELKPQDQ